MGSLFLEMDAAVTRELTADELGLLEPLTLLHVIEICARIAGDITDEFNAPRPPATQWIRLDLVIPGDFCWRTDMSFDRVDSISMEEEEMVIVYSGGRTVVHDPKEHLRVAVSPDRAIAWNEQRVSMDEQTLRFIAEAYGVL